jgi:hypothetical protein
MSFEIDYSAVEGNQSSPIGIDYSVVEGNQHKLNEIDYSIVEKPKAKEEDPSLAEIGGGLAAQLVLAEGAKYAGATAGASIGLLGGPLAGITSPTGALIGYGIGAVTGGAAGSIAAQKIEGKDNISYGRVVADTLMNFIPGSKLAKAATVTGRVAKSAVAGAVLAPVAQAIEKTVDTGEMPELDESAKTAAMGIALGAGLGLTAEATSRIIGKFAGKSAQELDSAIRSGDPDAVTIADAAMANVDPNLAKPTTAKGFVEEVMNFTKANLAPSKVLGRDVMRAISKAEGTIEAGKTGRVINRNIQRVIDASPDPIAAEESAYNYMSGFSSELPSSVEKAKPFLDFARERIAQSQDELIANHYNGSHVIPKETLQIIEESKNTGDYLTQEYKFFTTPKYQPSEKLRDDLVKSLVDEGQTPKQAEQYILELNNKKAGSPDDLEKFVYSSPGGILKEKKDLSPALRSYLGEITNTGERVEGTISKLANLSAYDTADLTIKNLLRSTGLAKIAGEGVDETAYTRLNLRRGLAKEGEDDLYVPNYVQKSINSLYGAQIDNGATTFAGKVLKDVFGTAAGLFKVQKVLASPGAHANQAYGQVASLLSQGINPFKNFKTNIAIGSSQFGPVASRLDIDNLKFRTRAIELGMLQEGVASSDIHRSFNQGPIGSAVRTVTGPVGKAFSIADIGYRMRAWDGNMEMLRKIFPQADPKIIEEAAASITHDTYPNYDKLSKSVRELSTYGAIGQFASFKLELIRNTYNQAVLAKNLVNGSFVKELSEKLGVPEPTGNAALNEGLKRMAGLSVVLGATAGGISMFNRTVGGVTKEKDKALRESVLAPYEQNTIMAMNLSEDKNKVSHTQVSYLIPQADIVGPMMAASGSGTFKEAIANSFSTATDGIEGDGILFFKSVYQALDNYNPKREEKISFKPEGVENQLERIGFVTSQFTPSFIKLWKDTHKAVDPKPMSEFALNVTGVRTRTTDIDKGAGFKIRSLKGNFAGLSHAYNSAKKQYAGEELNQAYQGINQDYQNNFKDLIKHASNLKILDKTEDQVIQLFRDNGIGASSILNALNGKIENLPEFERITPTSEFEKLQGKSRKEKIDFIRNVQDPIMKKALASRLQEEEKIKAMKISSKDKLIKSLGAVDGTRARYIVDIVNESPDPDGTLKQFVKRGLVDQTVMFQIKSLRKNK